MFLTLALDAKGKGVLYHATTPDSENKDTLLMREEVIRKKIRTFIIEDLIRDEEYALENDEGIITGGLMDSFSLAELGVYIEEEFDVYIPDADLTVDQMDTLDQIVARVMRGMKED